MVALTGIEPAGCQASSVQLGLSGCVFSSTQFDAIPIKGVWTADVLTWCWPEVGSAGHAGGVNSLPRRLPDKVIGWREGFACDQRSQKDFGELRHRWIQRPATIAGYCSLRGGLVVDPRVTPNRCSRAIVEAHAVRDPLLPGSYQRSGSALVQLHRPSSRLFRVLQDASRFLRTRRREEPGTQQTSETRRNAGQPF
jgi:hypothetical protein